MAKGKKSKGTTYVSKGEVGTNRAITKQRRREYIANGLARRINQMKALKQGKNVVLTVPNPNKSDTRARFIKESIDGKAYLKRMASTKSVMSS